MSKQTLIVGVASVKNSRLQGFEEGLQAVRKQEEMVKKMRKRMVKAACAEVASIQSSTQGALRKALQAVWQDRQQENDMRIRTVKAANMLRWPRQRVTRRVLSGRPCMQASTSNDSNVKKICCY
jgi:hypothetical protein